jgi:hypothetical protein
VTIDLRVVIEGVVGLLLSGLVSLAVYSINAKVEQRYLELRLELSEKYVSKTAVEALIARLEQSIAKLEEQVNLVGRNGLRAVRTVPQA